MSIAHAVAHGAFGRACLYELDRPMVPHAHREGHLIFHVSGPVASVVVDDAEHAAKAVRTLARDDTRGAVIALGTAAPAAAPTASPVAGTEAIRPHVTSDRDDVAWILEAAGRRVKNHPRPCPDSFRVGGVRRRVRTGEPSFRATWLRESSRKR